MPETGATAAALDTAAALLLREPEAPLRESVAIWTGRPPPPLERMRQDFRDVLCVPQSGRFVPPYEHVLRRARREGTMWFFPPARYDGGREVEGEYARLGFDRRRLRVAPVFAAPHLPGDHLGFMFAFGAFVLGLREAAPEDVRRRLDRVLAAFVRHHLGECVETYAALLEDRGGGDYLAAVADAVREAAAMMRRLRRPAGRRREPRPVTIAAS